MIHRTIMQPSAAIDSPAQAKFVAMLRAAHGLESRTKGERLEQVLDAYHAQLAAQGLAWIRRVGTPTKVLGAVKSDRRGRRVFQAAFDGEQGADFVGIDARGLHVAVEAKTHAGRDAWDSGIDPGGDAAEWGALSSRQWDEVRRAEMLGGTGMVILEAFGRVWSIHPSALVRHVAAAGRRTVRHCEIHTFARPLVGVAWWSD